MKITKNTKHVDYEYDEETKIYCWSFDEFDKYFENKVTYELSVNSGELIFFDNTPIASYTVDNEKICRLNGEGDWSWGERYGKWFSLYSVRKGTTTVKIKLINGKTYKLKITCKNNDDYIYPYETWRDNWIKQNINNNMTDMEKVRAIVSMIATTFKYDARYSSSVSLYKYKGGDCVAGNSMLEDFCDVLNIPCVLRYAGDDNIQFNESYGQYENHHNCIVWIDGVKYLADATPEFGIMFKWNHDTY